MKNFCLVLLLAISINLAVCNNTTDDDDVGDAIEVTSGELPPLESEPDTIPDCPEYQVWNDCASSCEPECENKKGEKCGPFMTLECVPKCTCIEGYAWLDEECAEIDSTKCGKLYVAPIEK